VLQNGPGAREAAGELDKEIAAMIRRTLAIIVLAVASLSSWAAAARADTVALSVAPDRVEEVPFMVTAAGLGGADHAVFATIKPVGPLGCGPTYSTDAGGHDVIFSADSEGAYTVNGTAEVDDPGTYLICAWVQEWSSDTSAYAATSLVVDVRQARASLVIHGKSRIKRRHTAVFDLSGASELDRYVYAKVKRTGSRGCGSSYRTDSGEDLAYADAVQGYFGVRETADRWDLPRRGRYLVCAWVQEDWTDLSPEAATSFRFRVR
jgi:hypothetical protein